MSVRGSHCSHPRLAPVLRGHPDLDRQLGIVPDGHSSSATPSYAACLLTTTTTFASPVCSHVPHLLQPLGENTPLCVLPPDRRCAHNPSTSHTPLISPSVSLQQMVLFGQNPSQGTLLRGSQFLLGAFRHPTMTHLVLWRPYRGASCSPRSQSQGA